MPVQPTPERQPASRRSVRRVAVVLLALFAVSLALAWWLTPVRPYATLKLDDTCGLFLFSPDGTMLVTSGSGVGAGRSAGPLRVWDVATGRERFVLAIGWKAIETVAFSPDSALVAAHEKEAELTLWNLNTGEEAASLRPPTKVGLWSAPWVAFRFSPDGRFVVFPNYRDWPKKEYVTFWNIETWQEQFTVEGSFDTLAFAPDGNTFGSFHRKDIRRDTEVLLWKIGKDAVVLKQLRTPATIVAFSPDLRTFAAAADLPDGNGEVVLFDIMTGERRWSVTFKAFVGERLQRLSFSANGKTLGAYGASPTQSLQTTLWDVTSTPKEIASFSDYAHFLPNAKWVIIPMSAGAKLIHLSAPERGIDLVVNGDFGRFGPWAMDTEGQESQSSFSRDSKMFIAKGISQLGQEPFLAKWLPDKFNPFPDSPGGPIVRVWQTADGRQLRAFPQCTDAEFSPDGKVLATLRDGKAIDLWKLPFRVSPGRVVGWSVVIWLIAVPICWVAFTAIRMVVSPSGWLFRFMKPKGERRKSTKGASGK